MSATVLISGEKLQYKETLSEAVFDIPDDESYPRFEVFDAYGRRAATRAYFRDEWERG